MKSLLVVAVIGGLLTVGGCSFDYQSDKTTPADQVPQMAFESLKQTGVRDGRTLYTMESGASEVYPSRKQMWLKNFRFQEYDSEGLPASTGEAGAAVIDTNSNDATVSGRLVARSEQQKVTITAEGGSEGGLTWINEDRILKTKPNTPVRLLKDDGSSVDARSMTLDLGSNRLNLEEGVSGTWIPETHQDAIDPAAASPGSPPPPPQ